jgi:transposase-like protein
MAKTRREFTPEFKREAVALLESSGRPQMQIAAELGIQPSMLRQWRMALMGVFPPLRPAGLTGTGPVSPVASPSDQAAEIARLRRELDRTRMERDVLKKRSASSRRCPSDVRFHRAACEHLAGASHVPRARSLPQRLLRLAISPRERPVDVQPSALDDVRRIHAGHHRRYGSRRVHAALRVEGRSASRGRVERLMRRHGIRALAGRRFRPCTTGSRHDLPIAPNLLKQQFSAALPNRVWLADITSLPTGEGWLYLACSISRPAKSSAGPCAITCGSS